MSERTTTPTLVFDGHCNLCNRVVHFVVAHEAKAQIRFAAATGTTGTRLAQASADPDVPDRTFLFVHQGAYLVRSDAALALMRYLRPPWRWLTVLRWVPRPLRDAVYSRIARNRYRMFGRREHCMVPDPHLQVRFLD